MTKLITCLALGILVVAETLHDHFWLAMIALVPFWLIAMNECFPKQKRPSETARPKKKSNHEVIIP